MPGWIRGDATRTSDVLRLAGLGVVARQRIDEALRLAGTVPDAAGWRVAVELLLWSLAVVLAAAGCICVVAYNWSAIGRFGKFALAQGVLVLLVAAAWRLSLARPAGQALLTLAIALIGPLLALFGQTYQTGADTYELFRGWALLALPWTVASRFAPAWLLWLGIVEVGALAYVGAHDLWFVPWPGGLPRWFGGVLFNALVLGVWEFAAARLPWFAGRGGPRALVLVTLGVLTAATAWWVFTLGGRAGPHHALLAPAPWSWAVAMAAGWWAYRVRTIDLGVLALGWLSVIVIAIAALSRLLFALDAEVLALFAGAAVLFGLSAWARGWLRQVGAERDGARR